MLSCLNCYRMYRVGVDGSCNTYCGRDCRTCDTWEQLSYETKIIESIEMGGLAGRRFFEAREMHFTESSGIWNRKGCACQECLEIQICYMNYTVNKKQEKKEENRIKRK